MLTLEDVNAAAKGLRGVAHRTPTLQSRTLDSAVGADVFVKAECFQRTGTFKFRGAYHAVATLSAEQRARGVATFSSGNHAQALALAARLFDVPAVIVMPEDTPGVKIDATRGYGAEVVAYDRYTQDRVELGTALARERGMTLVPPYEHPAVMAGQGTTALELMEDAGGLDVLVAPVGGGGLIAGCSTAVKGLDDAVRVVGVEPEAGDDTRRSLAAGERVRIPVPRTIADGLQADIPGALTFAVNRATVDEFVTVSDAQIVAAMRFLFERMKVVAEPSGAVGVAALLDKRIVDLEGRRIGVVLSGGNIGAERFCELTGWAALSTTGALDQTNSTHGI